MFYFSHPSILWFSLLAALPVIIHIINLHRHKKVLFSNVYLLKQLEKETRNIRKIRDLLLLLIRVMAILALVFIFAGPTLKNDTKIQTVKNKGIAFYIDNSFSMSLQNSNGTLLDFAKTYTKKISSSFYKNSTFTLITNDNVYTGLTIKDFYSHLDKVKVSPSQPQPETFSVIAKSNSIGKFFIFSDFQKENFLSFIPDSESVYYIFPLQSNSFSDIILDTCYLATAENTASNSLVFKVTNRSNATVNELPVKLFVNSELKSIKNVTIDPDATVTDTIKFTYSGSNETVLGKLYIADYPVTFDNTLFFSYRIKNKYTIAIVSEPDGFASYRYVSAAFTGDNNEAEFKIEKIPVGKINELETIKPDAVILDNLTDIPPHFDDFVRQLLKNGTSVIFFPSPNDYKSSSEFLTSISGGNFAKTDTGKHEIKTVEYSDKIFRNAIIKKKNAKLPGVTDIMPVENLPLSSSVIIKTQDDLPVLFYNKSYKGIFAVYPLAITTNKDFFASPLFFVSLYNTVTQKPAEGQIYYYCGKAYTITLPAKIKKDRVIKIKPVKKNTEFVPYQINTGNEVNIILKDNDILQAGFYKLYADSVEKTVAFNYNRAEAKFIFLSKDELLNKFRGMNNVKIVDSNLSLQKGFNPVSDKDLTKYFVAIALLLLLLETLLLKFYGKNKAEQ